MKYRLAILLATYNGEKYISDQIQSLLCQQAVELEIFISDDGSTDDTPKIIQEYSEKYPEIIHILKNDDKLGGACKNFLSLVKRVDADLYMFCDQDDVWNADKVKRSLDLYMERNCDFEPALIHTDLKVVDKDLNIINDSYMGFMRKPKFLSWKQYLVENNNVVGCTMLINRKLADYYKHNFDYIIVENVLMHDSFFAILAALVGKIVYLDESTIKYRQHEKNTVGAIKPENGLTVVLKKLQKLNQFKELQRKKELHIKEVLKCINEKNPKISISEAYVNLKDKGKLFRIIWLIKNGILRKGIKRNIYLFLVI